LRKARIPGTIRCVTTPRIEVVGVHPVAEVPGCFLVECVVVGASVQPDFGQVTQALPDRERSEWQVAYDEKLLDADGAGVIADLFSTRVQTWPDEARVSFFVHGLDTALPLSTPFGDVPLPIPTPRPSRLDGLAYEAP
jgi:hypothetical protein